MQYMEQNIHDKLNLKYKACLGGKGQNNNSHYYKSVALSTKTQNESSKAISAYMMQKMQRSKSKRYRIL